MDKEALEKQLIEFGDSLKGAEVYYRQDWDCYYFSLLGKCFGLMNDVFVTLKNTPENNILLRKNHAFITPGYYMNKQHWNSIHLKTTTLSIQQLFTLIHESYLLVYQSLKKSDRDIIEELPNR
ncbi:MAG: MmcQ/YjbR family DNA-binding protein [Acholeplasma sp.]|nr:MmcQ/YjbR family DNA-binding protein [Acholeplasma sp.]